MTTDDDRLDGKAAELRRAFDRSFAELPGEQVVRFEDLLAIRVASQPFAIRLRDVGGLFADKKITSLPSPVTELVGVAGFRGGVVPVYDLRALLGYALGEPSRWLLLVATEEQSHAPSRPIALAFDGFDGHLRVLPDAIAAEPAGERPGYVREVVRVGDLTRPIVHVASMFEAITRRAQQQQQQQQGLSERER